MNTENGVYQISITGGLVGIFSDTQSKIDKAIREINNSGGRVVQIAGEKTDLFSVFTIILLFAITLGIYTRMPGYYIVWERPR